MCGMVMAGRTHRVLPMGWMCPGCVLVVCQALEWTHSFLDYSKYRQLSELLTGS